MKDDIRSFPAEVKALRSRLDCTQAEFAKAVGVNLRTLQNWEIGRVIPEYHALILIGLRHRVGALLEKSRPKKSSRQGR